jgi:hypothetical protein
LLRRNSHPPPYSLTVLKLKDTDKQWNIDSETGVGTVAYAVYPSFERGEKGVPKTKEAVEKPSDTSF